MLKSKLPLIIIVSLTYCRGNVMTAGVPARSHFLNLLSVFDLQLSPFDHLGCT